MFFPQLADQGDRGRSRGHLERRIHDSRHVLEEPHCLGAIADQLVLGLLIMIEHELVVLAPDTRLLVTSKSSMSRIQVIAIRPDPASLDRATKSVGTVQIASPDAGPQTVERVIG